MNSITNTNAKFLTLILCVVVASCGGGGGGGGGNGMAASQDVLVSGKAMDGYLEKATIFLDLNGNGSYENGEPSAETGPNGDYQFTVNNPELLKQHAIVALVKAGITIDKDSPNVTVNSSYSMHAPVGKTEVISPITTLIAAKISSGQSASAAEAAVISELGFTSADSIDLYKNYVAEKVSNSNYQKVHNIAAAMAESLKSAEQSGSNDLKQKLAFVVSSYTSNIIANIASIKNAQNTSLALAQINVGNVIGGSGASSVLGTQVPFSTPVLAGTVDPLINPESYYYFVGNTYTATISGGGQDLIITGFQSMPFTVQSHVNSRINMFSWKEGKLVDVTRTWFPNRSDEILGSYAVKFADFFKSGRTDMIVVPGADNSDLTGPAYLFVNNGNSFTRTAIDLGNNFNSQDVAVVDLNGDGYLDFIATDTGSQMTIGINNKVNNFTLYNSKNSNGIASASGSFLAVGDFLNNGTVTFVIDGGLYGNLTYNGVQVSSVGLYSWEIDANNKLKFTLISTLPQSRFFLSKWSDKKFTAYENLGLVPLDINNDGKLDVALFSQPVKRDDSNYSEIQFLQNDGKGNFKDVTDDVLVDYNTNSRVSYVPRLFDINGDGLLDILASGGDGDGTSSQWLLKSKDGKYVAKWSTELTKFLTQTNEMAGGKKSSADYGNSVNFIKDPSGNLHLVTYVEFQGASSRRLNIYTSLLGQPLTNKAGSSVETLKTQIWPFMQPAENNQSLASSPASK